MRRAGLLLVADCSPQRFDTLRRRNHLTFSSEPALNLASGWGEFTLRDAFELRLILDLMEASGVGGEEARYITGNAFTQARRDGRFSRHPLNGPESFPPYNGEDIWVFGGIFHAPDVDFTARFCDAGALSELPMIVSRIEGGDPIARMVAANATRAAKFVRNRALEFSIEGATDFSDAWDL